MRKFDSKESVAESLNEILSYEDLDLRPSGVVRFATESMAYVTAEAVQSIKRCLDADRVLIYAEGSRLVFEAKWLDDDCSKN